jgi:hypothetical protein
MFANKQACFTKTEFFWWCKLIAVSYRDFIPNDVLFISAKNNLNFAFALRKCNSDKKDE